MNKKVFCSRSILFFLFLILQLSSFAQQTTFTINELLKIVKPDQPRLIYTFELQSSLDDMVAKDSLVEKDLKKITAKALEMIVKPLIDYKNQSVDLAAVELYNKVITLTVAARHTGRKEFFEKVMNELNEAVSLTDWNPKKFETMSLMTLSVSLGYDWLNTTLDGATKKKYSEAIYTKGLKVGLAEYEKTKPEQKGVAKNWINTPGASSVTNNSAMLIGALAVARDFPQAAANTISYASSSLSNALRIFPLSIVQEIKELDEVNLFLAVAGLKTSLGKDFGLGTSLGYKLINQSFAESGKNKLNVQEQFVYTYIIQGK